jgi:glycosyltransferase involved in cell wall biosynthesis
MPVFEDYMMAIDVCVNLRYPTAGETSGSLIRALAFGKPTLVSDVGQFVEIPDSCCWKVDLDRTEEALLSAYMQELAQNETVRQGMAENVLRYARANLSWEKVASQYAEFIEQLVQSSRQSRASRHLTRTSDNGK